MKFHFYHGHTFPEAKGVCVVIDVIRAFTTAAFAFAAGAEQIILVSSIEEAMERQRANPSLLLMGEDQGWPIEGFHFGNSPSEIQNLPLKGRTLIQRTSSGTQGVVGCRHASHILLSSFVVAEATIQRIKQLNPLDVSFISTGTRNGDEDLALAEYLHGKLTGKEPDPEAAIKRVINSPAAARILQDPKTSPNGPLDIELVTKRDYFPFAMEVFKEQNELIAKKIDLNIQ